MPYHIHMSRRVRLVIVGLLGTAAVAGAWVFRTNHLGQVTGRWMGAFESRGVDRAPAGPYDMAIELIEGGRYRDLSDFTEGSWRKTNQGIEMVADKFYGRTKEETFELWKKKKATSKANTLFLNRIFSPRLLTLRPPYLYELAPNDGDAIWYRRD